MARRYRDEALAFELVFAKSGLFVHLRSSGGPLESSLDYEVARRFASVVLKRNRAGKERPVFWEVVLRKCRGFAQFEVSILESCSKVVASIPSDACCTA